MTLLVATVLADTPDETYARAREAARWADWVEIRLDGPSGLPWDLRPFFALDKPALATVRHTLDGGRTDADDRTRAELLRRALLAGAAGIDIETWSDELPGIVKEARERGALVVVSRHDTDGTPGADAIVEELRAMRRQGADVAKLATRVTGPQDAVALVAAARAAQAEGIPYALMAVNDPFLRLMAPALGMGLAYGAIPGAPPATPGQVPLTDLRAAHRAAAAPARASTGATRAVFLLGHPVAHSKSPAMQDAAFAAAGIDARYLALDVAPAGLARALDGLRATNALGANLTVPHKEAALALVDEAAPTARAAGAVNTLVLHDGRLVGHNTDGAGALDALREAGVRVPGARALVLGAGGAARAVAHALKEAGAQVTLANRTDARAATVAQELGLTAVPWARLSEVMRAVDVLVNATTLGLHGERLPVALEAMPLGAAVLDCVYHREGTPLVRDALARGLRAVPGEAMLLHQGAHAFTLWTGRPAPVAAMRAALFGGGARA